MAQIKVRCPEHGDSSLTQNELTIMKDTSGRMNLYEFMCPSEESAEPHRQRIYTQPAIIRLLVASQVKIEYFDSTRDSTLPKIDLQGQIHAVQRADNTIERNDEILNFYETSIDEFNNAILNELHPH